MRKKRYDADEYCIYLSNLGVIDSIESFLSINKTQTELFLVAFRCFENIITNSCAHFPPFLFYRDLSRACLGCLHVRKSYRLYI